MVSLELRDPGAARPGWRPRTRTLRSGKMVDAVSGLTGSHVEEPGLEPRPVALETGEAAAKIVAVGLDV